MGAVSTLRRAILIGFVGATLWVLAPLVAASMQHHHYVPRADRDALVMQTVQSEIAVVTIAAVAWVLAGMVEPKG
jgi:hypothetical protein